MNKIITVALIAGGLLLLDSPEAAAHKQVRTVYQPSAHYRLELRRAEHMPRWLRRNRSFRQWYGHSDFRRNRYLAWHQLFDIYSRERHFGRNHERNDSQRHRH